MSLNNLQKQPGSGVRPGLWRQLLSAMLAIVLCFAAATFAETEAEENAAPAPASAEQTRGEKPVPPDSAYEEMAVLTEALMLVRRHYVEELTYQEILHGAINGMLQSLDPHSYYMDKKGFTDFKADAHGRFCGVGLEIGQREGMLTVVAPIDDSPAFRAGIVAGDRILKIDNAETHGMSIPEVADRLRGECGEAVALTLSRAGRGAFDVSLVREEVVVSSVRNVRMAKFPIGYLRLTKFDEQTMPTFREKIDQLIFEGMQALVVDLRSNPGGLLDVAVDVAGTFLKRGQLAVSIKGRAGEGRDQKLKTGDRQPLLKLPLAILLDEGSASAAEVVAGALRDHRRAVLIGERTFGKASVQTVVPLKSESTSAVRLTTAYYYTPDGHLIHGRGIMPDIRVTTSPEERGRLQRRRFGSAPEVPEGATDAQRKHAELTDDTALQRALDVLTALLAVGEK